MPTRDRTVLLWPVRHLTRKHKFLGSGGSMVARLKLKEIDGRAPPGVNAATLRRKAARKGEVGPDSQESNSNASPACRATCSNCGKPLKLQTPSRR